jgi:hypothetical protein
MKDAAESVDLHVLSMSCPDASGAFLAVVATRRINNLRVINMPVWFKSTPRNQNSNFVFLTLQILLFGQPSLSHSYWGSIGGLEFSDAGVPPHRHPLFSGD